MGVPQIRVNVDRTRASTLGMTQRDVANGLLVSLAGSSQTAPSFFLDPTTGVSYSVTVQTPQYNINSMDALLSTPVTPATETAGQQPQLLSNVATVTRSTEQGNVTHYNVQPTYDIYAGIQGRDLGGVSSDIQKIVDKVKLPRGSQITLRGQVQSMQSSFLSLGIGMAFAVVLVYALMAINFQSWIDPLIVVMALPGALSGILWMLFVTQTPLSVPALMGMIMGIGVATANSILLVTFANEQREQGKNAIDAALEAGATRIRPVLMTATAMMIGMMPMALGLSEGGEQNAPLGRAVIGALLVATFVTLFVVPVLYGLMRKSEPASAFAKEEQEEAEFEQEKGLPFDPSLPDGVVKAARDKKDEPKDGQGGNNGKDGKGDGQRPSANGAAPRNGNGASNGAPPPPPSGNGRNRFGVSSGDPSTGAPTGRDGSSDQEEKG